MREELRCGCGELVYIESDYSRLFGTPIFETRFSDFQGREIRVCPACERDLDEEMELTAIAETKADIRRREALGMSLGPHIEYVTQTHAQIADHGLHLGTSLGGEK